MTAVDPGTVSPDATQPIDPGEGALVVVGISNVIKGDVPKMGVGRMEEIAALPRKIDGLARELAAGELKGKRVPREHSYRTLLDRLSRGLSPDEVHELVGKFPPEASDYSGPFVVAVQGAMLHLKSIFPTSEYVTFTGPKTMTPPEDAVFTFLLQYMVIADPLSVFNLMAVGSLLLSQVRAVTQFFPTLAKNITAAVYAAIAREAAVKKSYRLPPRAAVGVANWLGRRIVEYQPGPKPRVIPTPKVPASISSIPRMAAAPTAQPGGNQ